MTGRVVVITGASYGIGRAAAREFARRGYRVGLVARGREGLEAARAEVEELGGEAAVVAADVAKPEEVEGAAERVTALWGRIDVWVNNAMVTVFGDVGSLDPEEIRRVTDVTYHGAVWGTLAALRRMKPRDRGTIIQVGSALAYRSIPLQAAYCGAKSALRGFTDSLRSELIHAGSRVHVTMVHLPAVNTPQFDVARSKTGHRPRPLGTIFQPEVAARAIAWSAENRRRELFVGLPTEQAILGTRLLPGALDWLLAKRAVRDQLSGLASAGEGNLFAPPAGDLGARGRFSEGAASRSPHLAASIHRNVVYAGAAFAGVLVAAGLRRLLRSR